MNISQYCSVSDASDPSPLQSPNVYNVSSVRPRDKKTRQEGTRPDQSQCSVSVRNIQMEWVRSWRSGGSNLTPTFNSPLQSCGHGLDLLAQGSQVQSQRVSEKLTRTVALQRVQSAQETMICSYWYLLLSTVTLFSFDRHLCGFACYLPVSIDCRQKGKAGQSHLYCQWPELAFSVNQQKEWVRSWRSGGSNFTPTFNSPLQSCGHGLDLLAQGSQVQSQRVSEKLTRTVALQRVQSAQETMICSYW